MRMFFPVLLLALCVFDTYEFPFLLVQMSVIDLKIYYCFVVVVFHLLPAVRIHCS